jgi:virginiamycin B lyase
MEEPRWPGSLPYAMTVDDADRLWFVETGVQPNRLVGFDPKTEHFISVTTSRAAAAPCATWYSIPRRG